MKSGDGEGKERWEGQRMKRGRRDSGKGEEKGRGQGGKRGGKGEGRRSVFANKNLRLHPWMSINVD